MVLRLNLVDVNLVVCFPLNPIISGRSVWPNVYLVYCNHHVRGACITAAAKPSQAHFCLSQTFLARTILPCSPLSLSLLPSPHIHHGLSNSTLLPLTLFSTLHLSLPPQISLWEKPCQRTQSWFHDVYITNKTALREGK